MIRSGIPPASLSLSELQLVWVSLISLGIGWTFSVGRKDSIAAFLILLAFSHVVHGEGWFWRPYKGGANYGFGDGSAYEDAWDKDREIDWSVMSPGDVLYVCGAHQPVLYDQWLRPAKNGIMISGGCPNDPGSLKYSSGTAGETITINVSDIILDRLEISNCWAAVTINSGSNIQINRLNIHDCGGFGIRAMTGGVSGLRVEDNHVWRVGNGVYSGRSGHSNWAITGNYIHDVSGTGDSHGIGLQSCEHCEISWNFIERANTGITLYRVSDGKFSDVRIGDNIVRDMRGAYGSTNINRGIEVTSANCAANPYWTNNVRIERNYIADIADAAVYVKVADLPGDDWAISVNNNRVRRAFYGLSWNLLRRAEAPGFTPWFPVVDNDWGEAIDRPPSFVPNCD
jgi:hypothetical protein